MELRPGLLISVHLISHVIHGDVGSFLMPSLQTLHVGPHVCYSFLDMTIHEIDGVRAGAKRLGRKKELSEMKKKLCLQHSQNPGP